MADLSPDSAVDDPLREFGPARRPERAQTRSAPPGVSDAVVEALGALSEALEVVENARGHLYAFHRLCGTADLTLQRAVRQLREAGQPELATEIDEVLVGRDVIADRWSYQVVEDYDANYWRVFRAAEAYARKRVGDVPMHVYEARMQHDEQHHGAGNDT